MTQYAQSTSVNRPEAGTRGCAPGAAGLTGTHRYAVQAEAVPAALEQVAQEIPGGRPSCRVDGRHQRRPGGAGQPQLHAVRRGRAATDPRPRRRQRA